MLVAYYRLDNDLPNAVVFFDDFAGDRQRVADKCRIQKICVHALKNATFARYIFTDKTTVKRGRQHAVNHARWETFFSGKIIVNVERIAVSGNFAELRHHFGGYRPRKFSRLPNKKFVIRKFIQAVTSVKIFPVAQSNLSRRCTKKRRFVRR